MARNSIVDTITSFRENVISRGGPQIAAMYEATLNSGSDPLVCYPLTVVIPGRAFQFYEHDIWGPARKIPVKRTYTQCSMTFVVYQDWLERTYIEGWMNNLLASKLVTGNSALVESAANNNLEATTDWHTGASDIGASAEE